ncbi:hypothetical protein R1flu_016609 [Riccia fluitans]|uniref:Uncharacterized protein n=1 Tax=Riccia fluitans TaxID=41844 RepID=A0ABD1YMB4_9MARC
MEAWSLGGLFAVDWSQTHEDLVEELSGHSDQKVAFSEYKYREKPGAWTSDVWREVYNLPKASPGGYVMKGKVQFTELQLLRLVKGDKRQSKSRVFLEQDPTAPTSDWGDAVEKMVTRQVKVLGACNEATCLGPYLAHLYSHFHEMENEQKEDSKKQKALEQPHLRLKNRDGG